MEKYLFDKNNKVIEKECFCCGIHFPIEHLKDLLCPNCLYHYEEPKSKFSREIILMTAQKKRKKEKDYKYEVDMKQLEYCNDPKFIPRVKWLRKK